MNFALHSPRPAVNLSGEPAGMAAQRDFSPSRAVRSHRPNHTPRLRNAEAGRGSGYLSNPVRDPRRNTGCTPQAPGLTSGV